MPGPASSVRPVLLKLLRLTQANKLSFFDTRRPVFPTVAFAPPEERTHQRSNGGFSMGGDHPSLRFTHIWARLVIEMAPIRPPVGYTLLAVMSTRLIIATAAAP